MKRALVLIILCVLAVGCLVRPDEPSLAAARGRPMCDRTQFAAADVMRGPISFVGLPPVELGVDVDWRMDPYRNRSWALNLHALRWVGRLVVAYETTGAADALRRAEGTAHDWVRDNPRGGAGISEWAWAEHPIALRAPALVCLSTHVKAEWLSDTLVEHAEVLADASLYEGGHNHGLDQDIALLGIGCRLDVAKWRDLALRRMTESARRAIDGQGTLQEQAPRYGVYVHQRLGVAFAAMKECGLRIPKELSTRRRALESYVGHAIQPDGRLTAIGDGPADMRPSGFRRPDSTVGVFDGGYVFGRSDWSREAAFYSIRFGPPRRYHGHEDHLSVTYQAKGRDVLVEAGFHSYERAAYPRWTVTPEAHNVPVVEGAAFRPGTATRLTGSSITPTRQTYELTDDAYGVSRTRKVLVNHGTDVLAVLDEVPEGHRLRNLWHLAPGQRPTLVQFEMPTCRRIGGQREGVGEISPGYLKRVKTVTITSPAARSLLTVIVPGRARVSCDGGTVTVRSRDGSVAFPSGIR
ncbi:hypothetical protein GCM10020219_035330 [Nonomuraea dietziae]